MTTPISVHSWRAARPVVVERYSDGWIVVVGPQRTRHRTAWDAARHAVVCLQSPAGMGESPVTVATVLEAITREVQPPAIPGQLDLLGGVA